METMSQGRFNYVVLPLTFQIAWSLKECYCLGLPVKECIRPLQYHYLIEKHVRAGKNSLRYQR